jgi:hypothetical protein
VIFSQQNEQKWKKSASGNAANILAEGAERHLTHRRHRRT